MSMQAIEPRRTDLRPKLGDSFHNLLNSMPVWATRISRASERIFDGGGLARRLEEIHARGARAPLRNRGRGCVSGLASARWRAWRFLVFWLSILRRPRRRSWRPE